MRNDDHKLIVGHSIDLPENAKGGDRVQLVASDGVNQHLKNFGHSLDRSLGIE